MQLNKMLRDIETWQEKTHQCLDEALRDDVGDLFWVWQGSHRASKPLDYLEHVLVQVEPGVYHRCMAALGDSKSEASPSELRDEADLATAIEVLYCGLWTYCCNLHGVGIDEAASEFIENYCRTEISQASQDIKALEDAYMIKLRKGFVKAYLADEGLMPGHQRPIESATIQLIRASRYEGHLKPEYISWATSKVDPGILESCCARVQAEVESDPAEWCKQLMGSVNWIRQEFWPDPFGRRNVVLVLYRGTCVVTLRHVPTLVLKEMGWVSDRAQNGSYWRYVKQQRDTPDGVRNHIFRVDMDENVLGMWLPDGSEVRRGSSIDNSMTTMSGWPNKATSRI